MNVNTRRIVFTAFLTLPANIRFRYYCPKSKTSRFEKDIFELRGPYFNVKDRIMSTSIISVNQNFRANDVDIISDLTCITVACTVTRVFC